MAWLARRGNDEHPHFEFGRQAVYVNHYYCYIYDREWGPGFVKTNAYAPYPVWVYLNGHEWAKRQAARPARHRLPGAGQRLRGASRVRRRPGL